MGGGPASLLECGDTKAMIPRPEAGAARCRLNRQGRLHEFACLNRPTGLLGLQSLSCQHCGAMVTHFCDSVEVISTVSVEPDYFRQPCLWWHGYASSTFYTAAHGQILARDENPSMHQSACFGA